jgi:hypothetical protein
MADLSLFNPGATLHPGGSGCGALFFNDSGDQATAGAAQGMHRSEQQYLLYRMMRTAGHAVVHCLRQISFCKGAKPVMNGVTID